jgi:hypothetical protein
MKRFWLIVAHVAVIGAGTTAAVLFPPAALAIVPAMGAVNALIPSPMPALKMFQKKSEDESPPSQS